MKNQTELCRSLFTRSWNVIKKCYFFNTYFSSLKHKEYQREISIESIKIETYKKAERWFIGMLWFNIVNFIFNIVFQVLTLYYLDNPKYHWIIFNYSIFFIILYLIIFIGDKKYAKYRNIAEELRIIQFNKANLNIEMSPEKKSYFLPCVISNTISPYNVEINFNANYFENQNLKYSLLQNIFFSQKNFRYHAGFYLASLLTFLFGTIISAIFFAIFSNCKENGTLIFQIVLAFLNLITTSRYFLIFLSFNHKAEILKDLDNELVKTNSINENKAISLLIEYNSLLIDAYPTLTCIYNKHKNILNIAWNERISSYDKTMLVFDFKENIGKDLKLLLSSLKKYIYKGYVIIGSYLDLSFVNGKSDLDILLVFESTRKIIPKEFYYEIFEVLKIRFGNNLIESLPAFIVKSFGDITLEFTPCIQIERDKYKIVNSNYIFEEICPQKYSDYFQTCNKNTDGLFYSLSKEVIECKYREYFSISSIYIKIYLSEFIQVQESDRTLVGFLKELIKVQLRGIRNSVEPHKTICPCPEKEKMEIIEKIKKFIKDNKNGKFTES